MKTQNTFYPRYGKRWFDLLLTVPGYVVISPLMGLIALLVRLQLGSPVLFKQVRPGLTGWAQVNGRNAITWEEKFALDVWYVDHCSVFLDVRIILLTLLKVFRREGIAADGAATMPEFMGSRKGAKAQR